MWKIIKLKGKKDKLIEAKLIVRELISRSYQIELHPKLILKSYPGSKKVKRTKHNKIDFEEMNS